MGEKSLNKCLYVKAIYKIFISKDHDANALKTAVFVLNTLKKGMSRRFMRISFLSKFFLFVYFSVLFHSSFWRMRHGFSENLLRQCRTESEKKVFVDKTRTTPPCINGVKWLVIKIILRNFKCDAFSILKLS